MLRVSAPNIYIFVVYISFVGLCDTFDMCLGLLDTFEILIYISFVGLFDILVYISFVGRFDTFDILIYISFDIPIYISFVGLFDAFDISQICQICQRDLQMRCIYVKRNL